MPANNNTDEIKKYEQYQKSLDSLEGDALLDAINNMAEEEVVGIDESDEYSDTDKNDVLQKISDTPVIDVDDYREINSELEQTEENAAEERSETENNMQEEKLASHENALQTLIKENVSDDDEDDEDFVVDNYHYYDTAAILKYSDISNEKMREAEAKFLQILPGHHIFLILILGTCRMKMTLLSQAAKPGCLPMTAAGRYVSHT